ncbi:AI-2E family transporter [Geomonas limicola]|uniref:AI-2E family transporter n=1 Tax=Geomonas limicola TaxID=2740186 RepID=A0A6V8N9V8_9BACT|nr:AI-2E family transporter [Geomonas limicola]GFO69358.1 AI-2E family transporter [Geomonas limicola]
MSSSASATNRAVLILLVGAALFAAGHALRHTTSCFLLSFVIAYLLDPLVLQLEKRGISRPKGILVLYLGLSIFAVFFFSYFVPFVLMRWQALIPSIPLYLQKARDLAAGLEAQIQPYYGAEEWSWAVDKAVEGLNKLFSTLGTGVYNAAASLIFNIFNLVLSPILVFFMLFYKAQIKKTLTSWLPWRRREVLLEIGNEVNESIGGYLRGQLIVSFIVALFSSIALVILDVDYALFNGIFAGLASVLPFIGVIIATIPALFFAYLKFQSGLILVKVVISFAAIYFLEGYLVKPLVFKRSMNLNPLLTIIMVMALGELFGFWGILLAIPVAAAAKIVSVSIERGDFREWEEP